MPDGAEKSFKAENYATAKDVGRGFAEALKRFYAAFQLHRYARISTVSGLSRKLLQALNRIGQFEMATICGISASMVM